MGSIVTAANNAMMNIFMTMTNVLMTGGGTGGTGGAGGTGGGGNGGGFDLIAFFDNAAGYLKKVGHYIMVLAGVILVIVAVVQIAKGLAGGRQVNWVMSIACLLVGGMLIFGGWNLAAGIAAVGKDTIETLGGGSVGGAGIGDDGGGQTNNSGFQQASN